MALQPRAAYFKFASSSLCCLLWHCGWPSAASGSCVARLPHRLAAVRRDGRRAGQCGGPGPASPASRGTGGDSPSKVRFQPV
eukprot:249634-Hanusia_phi.AAC.2